MWGLSLDAILESWPIVRNASPEYYRRIGPQIRGDTRETNVTKTQARQLRRRDGDDRSYDNRGNDRLSRGRIPAQLRAAGGQRYAVHQPRPGDRRGDRLGTADHPGLAAARRYGRGAAVCDGGEHARQQTLPPLPEPQRLYRPIRVQPRLSPRGGGMAARPGVHRHYRRRPA